MRDRFRGMNRFAVSERHARDGNCRGCCRRGVSSGESEARRRERLLERLISDVSASDTITRKR